MWPGEPSRATAPANVRPGRILAAGGGWQLATSMRTSLVLDALRMALSRRQTGADVELVITPMRVADLSSDLQQVLDDHRVLASIGSVGDAYDAMAESFVDTSEDGTDRRSRLQKSPPARAGGRRMGPLVHPPAPTRADRRHPASSTTSNSSPATRSTGSTMSQRSTSEAARTAQLSRRLICIQMPG